MPANDNRNLIFDTRAAYSTPYDGGFVFASVIKYNWSIKMDIRVEISWQTSLGRHISSYIVSENLSSNEKIQSNVVSEYFYKTRSNFLTITILHLFIQ